MQKPQPGQPQETPAPQSASDAVHVLEQALAHFEAVLDTMEERVSSGAAAGASVALSNDELARLKDTFTEVADRLEAALEQLASQARLLSHEASGFTAVADRLEGRMRQLAETVEQLQAAPVRPQEPLPPAEPQFLPNGQAVRVVLAAVPGFQGLMEAQRALSGLHAAEGASVVAYKNGEASLEVTLRAPVTAREIVEGLHSSTGHQLLIEEARPEALRLRLRFVE